MGVSVLIFTEPLNNYVSNSHIIFSPGDIYIFKKGLCLSLVTCRDLQVGNADLPINSG